ncbi:cinnamycin family lantibiotic [Actinomadura syzygii]|uniref:Cinnamycin family lantibiotic n=1 Tax=Actinomadura syzygii TaxID=1427538 RepID=A0A5D0UD71_9ACTN|nr:cinnamycin family lantibiotic [Actinomadura syzygii]TYC16004.1 cinnamycin family lantibiotic [Actinomadura syzygii]
MSTELPIPREADAVDTTGLFAMAPSTEEVNIAGSACRNTCVSGWTIRCDGYTL